MSHEQIIIDGLVREIERMKKNDENNQNSLAAYRKEVMDIGTRLSNLNNALRSLKGKAVFPVEDPNSKGKFAFLESYPLTTQDSVHPLPGSGPDIALKVKEINENTLNAMCNREGQTESPLKKNDGLWHPSHDWRSDAEHHVEPAPGSDADHPPVGYRLVNAQGVVAPGALFWSDSKVWKPLLSFQSGLKAFQYSSPIASPIPANEGDSRVAESVAIPVGWVERIPDSLWAAGDRSFHGLRIAPDPSIPWGEGYEAILPSEARDGGSCEYWCNTGGHGTWTPAYNVEKWEKKNREDHPWRCKAHPEAKPLSDRVAESIADDVQRMQVAIETLTDERDRALARVAELEAKNALLEVENRTLHGLVRRMREVLL